MARKVSALAALFLVPCLVACGSTSTLQAVTLASSTSSAPIGDLPPTEVAGRPPEDTIDGPLACAPAGAPCAFVRTSKTLVDESVPEDAPRAEIWLRGMSGNFRLLATTRAGNWNANDIGFTGPTDLRFSPDGKHLYAATNGWVTSPAIQEIDLATGSTTLVCDGTLSGFVQIGNATKLDVVRFLLDLDHDVADPSYGGRQQYRFYVDAATHAKTRVAGPF